MGTLDLAWQRPKLNPEERLIYTDSLAGLLVQFGYDVLDGAVEFQRERATNFRPTIRDIRDYCEAHKPPTREPQALLDAANHDRDVRRNPERYVPVEWCAEVGVRLGTMAKMRKGAGKPMSKREYDELKATMTAEMNQRWLDTLKTDPPADRKTVAAGVN